MRRIRVLSFLGILLTLALLTHALIERVRSSPLYVAEVNYTQLRAGMTMSEVNELLGPDSYVLYGDMRWPTGIRWPIVTRDSKSCAITVTFEQEPRVGSELVVEPVYDPKAEEFRFRNDFTWLERIALYIRH